MLLQTAPGGWQFGLLVLVLVGVGLVSYWVYRDAAARGMDDAPYWGAAVGVASVIGFVVGGIVAVGVYLSARPEAYEGGERPFDALWGDAGTLDEGGPASDPAHADLPPVPELTAERVADASETTLRGYARRYDRLDATGDPEGIRAALMGLVEADDTDRLGETLPEAGAEEGPPGRDSPAPDTDADHRRHLGRPRLRSEDAGVTADIEDDTAPSDDGTVPATEEATDGGDRGFEWVAES